MNCVDPGSKFPKGPDDMIFNRKSTELESLELSRNMRNIKSNSVILHVKKPRVRWVVRFSLGRHTANAKAETGIQVPDSQTTIYLSISKEKERSRCVLLSRSQRFTYSNLQKMLLEIVIANFVFVDANFQLSQRAKLRLLKMHKNLSHLQPLQLNHLY